MPEPTFGIHPELPDRPRPLREAATGLVRWLGVAGSLVLALVGWGVLTAAQGDAITGLLGAIPGAVNTVTTVLVAFGLVRRAEPLVTPVADPRDNRGVRLIPEPKPGGLTGEHHRH